MLPTPIFAGGRRIHPNIDARGGAMRAPDQLAPLRAVAGGAHRALVGPAVQAVPGVPPHVLEHVPETGKA